MSESAALRSAAFGPVTVYFGEKSGKYPDGNQVMVRGRDTLAAFDTPLVANRIGAAFESADMVILGHVHEDHMAGLHRVPRAKVFAPAADLAAAQSWQGLARHYGYSKPVLEDLKAKIEKDFFYAPRPDAVGYADGEIWDLGGARVRSIHMPGHTSGHTVLLVEPQGVAFIGDIDLSGFGPYYGDATSSLAEFRRSLARLPELPAKVWVTSHHRGVLTERAHFLDSLAAFTAKLDDRERRLLGLISERPRTLDELAACRLLYPPGHQDLWVEEAERRSISQHLDELLAGGRVARLEDGRYRAA